MTSKLAHKSRYALVYAFGEHPYLGYLLEPHVVKLNANGSLSFTYKRVFSNTLGDYESWTDETDRKIIELLDQIEQSHIIKTHHKKNIRASDFFTKVFDDSFYDFIRPKIETKILEALSLVGDKPLFMMSKDGYPADIPLTIASEPASVLFHFRRNVLETRYFPTIKFQGKRIDFMFKDAQILINQEAWLLLDQVLYHFDQPLEGRKLTPFLQKRYISVPRATEKHYFDVFVRGLIEKHHVYAEGFDIKTHQHDAKPILRYVVSSDGREDLQLHFKYGSNVFSSAADTNVTVRMAYDEEQDLYTFHRIKRSLTWENNRRSELEKLGFAEAANSSTMLDWLVTHYDDLIRGGFEIDQMQSDKTYQLRAPVLDLVIEENNDWFDVNATARFGAFEIPFLDLKSHILDGRREFKLPNGEYAIIPETWFARYAQLFQFSRSKKHIQLNKHHVGLLNELNEHDDASMDDKLQGLKGFEKMEQIPVPEGFRGSLRPYQLAGYQWFNFLKKYGFGGCLADDMGLGKTIQTLAHLQREHELALKGQQAYTSLIIMPTSLIYNWQNEADKFTPDLKLLVHTGNLRTKDPTEFAAYDVIITTYGIARMDAELLQEFYFHYLILDESQYIKNPSSKSFRAIRKFKAKHRLTLSGTPIENSIADLWSQMSLLNPGLLGTLAYFQDNFVIPIEKKKDESRASKLNALIKPFMLRRTKVQVASELPPKSEQVVYCQMTEEQEEFYEKTKSEYRNTILEGMDQDQKRAPQMALLQGLTKLRQIANHPVLVDPDYNDGSGKLDDVLLKLEGALQRGNKVLIFSQFVRHLEVFRKYFEREGIKYAYLDGSTKDRVGEVERFSNDKEVRVFLISIKAGGVGINLTEADYVFILDPWWNPAVEQQAIDRTHRIGQTKNVFIYKFISKNTIEDKIVALQQRKSQYAEDLIRSEESFFKSLTPEDIRDLLN